MSWQVNDPLVNSHGSDYAMWAYSPRGFPLQPRYDQQGNQVGWMPVPGTEANRRTWVRRQWLSSSAVNDPIYGMGVNLSRCNRTTGGGGSYFPVHIYISIYIYM